MSVDYIHSAHIFYFLCLTHYFFIYSLFKSTLLICHIFTNQSLFINMIYLFNQQFSSTSSSSITLLTIKFLNYLTNFIFSIIHSILSSLQTNNLHNYMHSLIDTLVAGASDFFVVGEPCDGIVYRHLCCCLLVSFSCVCLFIIFSLSLS
jgi:hypothetical protein